ncbi:uncharacterized protein HGUI_00530 [Hanseniaspora guilliermondii]|uniref:Large ribosomal subunit protein mL59 domain-containing protein n=1 Tax=Hanseniaspora guilliermondii TaxID=56406 RepID=A0A1L0AV08_9ASCO|nr:uncharacterized protein HGUI_00530 [Hanseniaspora guilliermondii]
MLHFSQTLRQSRNVENALRHIKALQLVQNTTKPKDQVYTELFENLPNNVKSFFAKYPPNLKYKKTFSSSMDPLKNPFLPSINPLTKVWETPAYDKEDYKRIYHVCYRYGLLDLLPRPESLAKNDGLNNFVEPVTNEVINLNAQGKLERNLKIVLEYSKFETFFEEKVDEINTNTINELKDIIIMRKEKEEKQLAKKKQMEAAIANMDNIIVDWKTDPKKKELYMKRQKINAAKKLKIFA